MSFSKKPSSGSATGVPKRKRVKQQVEYHSSSSEDENELAEADENEEEPEDLSEEGQPKGDDTEDSDVSSSGSDQETEEDVVGGKRKKRNDPNVFATSISKILNSKLTSSKRVDPVLSRSKDASAALKEMSEARLEVKAKQKLRNDKRAKQEIGRVKDVLGLNNTEVSTEDIIDQERKYKKLAQRGVVRMFNAIRAAQVMGEQAARDAHNKGVVGIDKREQKVNEMSKKGFLELIAGGGKK